MNNIEYIISQWSLKAVKCSLHPQCTDMIRTNNTFANMPPSIFNSRIPVNIWQEPQAKPVLVIGGISEAIHQQTCGRGMKCLSNTIIEFIIDNRAPVLWLFISNCLNICNRRKTEISNARINEFLSFKVLFIYIHCVDFGLRSGQKNLVV